VATPSLQPSAQPIQADDEIDLGQLVASLVRRRRLIACVTGGTVLLTGLVTVLQKPVWEGEFQIVLASKDSGQSSGAAALIAQNPGLAGLAGISGAGKGNQLETEVKILQSPSVLKPVYDFVRAQKRRSIGNDIDGMRYDAWVKASLDIKLEKGTSVLNLAYRDNDKDLVLPVIERISREYQAYSGRDRERGLANGVAYLNQQIAYYRVRSLVSLRTAQQYAIEQDLTALKGDDETKNAFNLEAVRVQAANEIRNYDEQLIQLRKLSNDPEAIQFRGLMIPELASKGVPQQIEAINLQLASLRQTYTDRELLIKNLVKKRQFLIELFKSNTINYVLAKRADAQARLAAAQRPKGVQLKYRELLRVAIRDEATLNKLEDERRSLALEQARKADPWELISTPTLLDRPVAPRNGRNLALGLLAGLVLGSGAALVAERRTGRIHGSDELASLLPGPLLAVLEAGEPESWRQPLQLLSSGPLAAAQTLALVPIGPEDGAAAAVAQALEAASGRPVLCSCDLVATRRCDAQVLITSPGAAERDQLHRLRRDLELQGSPVVGWLLLNDRRPRG
jgi:uncharacterized protein involved in exopolysaccharide biosynthesis